MRYPTGLAIGPAARVAAMENAATDLRRLCAERIETTHRVNGINTIFPPLVSVDAVLKILEQWGL